MIRILIVFISTFVFAFPNLTSRVVDEALILDDKVEQILEKKLEIFEQNTTNQLVFVSVKSLQGQDILEYAVNMARSYKLGQKGKDNGILLLVAPNEREVAIQVGYGLESALTDALSSLIINNIILPKFKKGDINGGILDAVDAIIMATKGEFTNNSFEENSEQNLEKYGFWLIFGLVLLTVFSSKFKILSKIARSATLSSFLSFFILILTQNLYIFGIVFVVIFVCSFLILSKFKTINQSQDLFDDDFRQGGNFGRGFDGRSGGFKGGGGSFGGGGARGRW